MNSFDILITSFNRPDTLKNCLDSLPKTMPVNFGKIILLVQSTDSDTKKLIESFYKFFEIILLEVPFITTPGASRNILVSAANSEFLCFLDDDIQVSTEYFDKCNEILIAKRSDIFGGPDQSPKNNGIKQQVIGELMSHQFVMGPTSLRHYDDGKGFREADETILTLCNIWFSSSIFEETKLSFDEDIQRCEENKLLSELNTLGHKMYYYPDMIISHFRRESNPAMIRIQYLSGYYRSVCFFKTRASFKPFFLLPLMTGFLICYFVFLPLTIQLSLIGIHSVIAFMISAKIAKGLKSFRAFIMAWQGIIIIHSCFSLGMFMGILSGWRYIGKSKD